MALVKCIECNNKISDKASICPRCGAPAHHTKIQEHRAAVTQARLNENLSSFLVVEIFIVSILSGVYAKSWLVFGGTVGSLFILLFIPVIGKVISFVLALLFGVIGYKIGDQFFGQAAGYVIGGLIFCISLGANFGGIDYMKDLGRE